MRIDESEGYHCTVRLLEVISNITLFTIYMQGALYAVDELHCDPWQFAVKMSIILKSVFEGFQNLKIQLNNFSTSQEDLKDCNSILHSIELNIKVIKDEIRFDIYKYCELHRDNMLLLTEKLKTIYGKIELDKESVVNYNSGCKLILDEIEKLFLENFTNLGFQFNSLTGKTFIPESLNHLFKSLGFWNPMIQFT
ncbi:uncharacterized protein LOC126899431 isoform X2 [Daktulosphaira vitifoliae]|uniref:uncharacterized protein LOC126899431 isoform X2 n=1 Tax=Daktulosphaira vitifoliae TaxID=58002 RepID=UPI0021AA468D|nr:uncharacterized protein LOC126899431 isoform X2 [Daktulosphaira vitifoliae]